MPKIRIFFKPLQLEMETSKKLYVLSFASWNQREFIRLTTFERQIIVTPNEVKSKMIYHNTWVM